MMNLPINSTTMEIDVGLSKHKCTLLHFILQGLMHTYVILKIYSSKKGAVSDARINFTSKRADKLQFLSKAHKLGSCSSFKDLVYQQIERHDLSAGYFPIN